MSRSPGPWRTYRYSHPLQHSGSTARCQVLLIGMFHIRYLGSGKYSGKARLPGEVSGRGFRARFPGKVSGVVCRPCVCTLGLLPVAPVLQPHPPVQPDSQARGAPGAASCLPHPPVLQPHPPVHSGGTELVWVFIVQCKHGVQVKVLAVTGKWIMAIESGRWVATWPSCPHMQIGQHHGGPLLCFEPDLPILLAHHHCCDFTHQG